MVAWRDRNEPVAMQDQGGETGGRRAFQPWLRTETDPFAAAAPIVIDEMVASCNHRTLAPDGINITYTGNPDDLIQIISRFTMR